MPESKSQVRLAHAVLSGQARDASMSRGIAREIVREMHGRRLSRLPEKKKRSRMRRRTHG